MEIARVLAHGQLPAMERLAPPCFNPSLPDGANLAGLTEDSAFLPNRRQSFTSIPKGESLMNALVRRFATGLMAATLLLGTGCVFAPVVPPRGILWTDQKAPLFSGRAPGSKEGKSHAHNILFLAGWGDASMQKAMEDGGITEVRHSDYRIQNYMLIYQRYTTIVYGE